MNKKTKIYISISVGVIVAIVAGVWLAIALSQPKPTPYFDPFSSPPPNDGRLGRNEKNPLDDVKFSPTPVSPAGQGVQSTTQSVPQKSPLYFSLVNLPFIDDTGVNPGGGFILQSKETFAPNEEFKTVIFPRGASAESAQAYTGKTITANAQGGLNAVYPLPTKLSFGTYTLELSSVSKKFDLNFTLISAGSAAYDGSSAK